MIASIYKGPAPKPKCYCGLANRVKKLNRVFSGTDYIYNGITTKRNEFPWMARIHFRDRQGGCGGSLINSRWILSAGHCVKEVKKGVLHRHYAILGDHDVTDPNEGTEVERDISEIIRHPKYKLIKEEDVKEYDIALFKMKNDINFMKHPHIRPVCLPRDILEDYAGWDATLTGWGLKFEKGWKMHAEQLQYLTGPVQSNQECSQEIKWSLPAFSDSFLCVADVGGSPCIYDSGGPLVTKPFRDDGVTPGQNYQQIGVLSFGDGTPCNSSGYGVYARITTVLGWIKESVGIDHTNCPRE